MMADCDHAHPTCKGLGCLVELDLAGDERRTAGSCDLGDQIAAAAADDADPASRPVRSADDLDGRNGELVGQATGEIGQRVGRPGLAESSEADSGILGIGLDRPNLPERQHGGELVVDPAGSRVPGGVAAPDADAATYQVEQDLPGARLGRDSSDRPERKRVVGDDEISLLSHRLGGHLRSQGQAGDHPADFRAAGADEQADGIPLGRQPKRGNLVERGKDVWEKRHRKRILSRRNPIATTVSDDERRAMDATCLSVPVATLAHDLRKGLRMARDLGVRAVELDARHGLDPAQVTSTGRRQIRKWLGDEGLVVSAIAFPTRGGYGDPDRLEGRIAATKAALQLAYDLGSRVVLNHLGEIPPADDAGCRLLVDVLSDLATWSHHVGATLCAEAGRAAPADLARLIAALPEGGLTCDLVTGSLLVHGYDPAEAVEILGGHIASVHATDAVAGPFAGRGRAVILGTGQVDFPPVFAKLDERHYDGWIGLEPVEPRQAHSELGDAIHFLRAL